MTDKIVFYKVYQDKNNIDGQHYVDTLAGVTGCMSDWEDMAMESEDELFPVLEPVLMTQEEFDALPEFTGY